MSEDSQPTAATPGAAPAAETRIYLARHAEPEGADGLRRFFGQIDPPLSATGQRQAQQLARRLEGVSFRAIHSSDLRRCVATAEAVAHRIGLPVIREPALREIDAGRWEGLSFEEAKRLYPAEYAERECDLLGFHFPDGESFRELERRVAPAFCRIMDSGPGDVLVVAHKGVNRVLLAHFLEIPMERMFDIPLDYCAVSLIRVSTHPAGGRHVAVEAPS
jgi:alpha-ribazole phosphatase